MKIADRQIGNGAPTYIIGEAGTNHFGDVDRAKTIVDVAASCGADAVKFQAFDRDEPLFCPYDGDDERIPYWNGTVMTDKEWKATADRAHEKGIHFILSVFQTSAMRLLSYCDAAKVASRAAMNYPYNLTDKPLIISEGFVKPIMLQRRDESERQFIRLACVPEYPTALAEALPHDFEHHGLSDHSGTPYPAMYAVAHGCPMIEVHFLNPQQRDKLSRDRVVELVPSELQAICDFRDAVTEMTQ